MNPDASFTGRARRRTTRPGVRFGDTLARAVITLGGIGTIAAVLLMGLFLLAVALPLFRPASIGGHATTALGEAATEENRVLPVIALGTDESGEIGWSLDLGVGRMRLLDLAAGSLVLDRPLEAAGVDLSAATVLRVHPGSTLAVVGFGDGAFRLAAVGVESTYIPAAEVAVDVRNLPVGGARPDAEGAVLRTGVDRWARIRVVAAAAGEPTRELSGGIVDVDVTPLSGGPLVAAVDDTGAIRVERRSTKRNMLTGKEVTKRDGATIPAEAEVAGAAAGKAIHLRLSELGDQLWAIAADGRGRRYSIRAIDKPVLMETFDAGGGADVTAVVRLFGGNALAVGDAAGVIRVFFTSRQADAAAEDGLAVLAAKTFPAADPARPAAVTTLAASPRSRLFAAADAAGTVRLFHSTAGTAVLSVNAVATDRLAGAPRMLAMGARETTLLAADGRGIVSWGFDAGYPEISAGTLFRPVWYESYPGAVHAWETTGHQTFESKFGFIPLVVGTIKATVYVMLFATPVAILAAIFSSQFLHPSWRGRIKPVIEMMASLPSVVLGFMAGLVIAPLVERGLAPVIAGFFVVPLTLLLGAHLWQLFPAGVRMRLAAWRLPIIGCLGLPAGAFASLVVAPQFERLLFGGDLRAWLDGRGGSGLGGWVLAFLPITAIVATVLCSRLVNPWLRSVSVGWTPRRAGLVSLGVFVVGVALTVGLAVAAGTFLDAIRLDARGGLLGSYVQRNAMIVAFGMSFAVIPLIFTIADDALSSVPDHLRSASLGAGATPWQTAIRVILPAAASGLFSAVMIGLGRAVGETMIVLMAAGNTPIMDWSLFSGFQTLSAAIATELPEAARGSAHYRVLFLAALTLFGLTFILNTVAEIIRERFRRRSHEL
ncbi:MAG: ABC transporter permease subunit [Planctomycetota bacterium]|nr:ABC transporter permease subunit [Planctomycetota bacterium]